VPRYQIVDEGVLWDWLAHEPDASKRQAMLEWMVELSERPRSVGQRLPEVKAPVYLALTPVHPHTLVYLVADEFRAIRLIRFGMPA
jgi:hypothetical protein